MKHRQNKRYRSYFVEEAGKILVCGVLIFQSRFMRAVLRFFAGDPAHERQEQATDRE